jgi:cytochrome c oxidase subunit II
VPADTAASKIDTLYDVLLMFSVPIFVLVMTVAIYSVIKFRARPGDLGDGAPIHGNTRLEVFWTALPTVLLLGLVSYSFVVLHENEKKPANEIQVELTAQQFAWTFEYPGSVTGGVPVHSTELVLPLNRSVRFDLRSKDVIHAFWIPAFRLQEDVVPGITVHYRATPDLIGTYPIVCNLLCGIGHSLMRSQVHVVTPERFRSWLASRQGLPSG